MYFIKLRKSKSIYNNFRSLKNQSKLGLSKYSLIVTDNYRYKETIGHLTIYKKSMLTFIRLDFRKFSNWVSLGAKCDLLVLHFLQSGGIFDKLNVK